MNPKDQIKQTLSILDVVSTYVRLEKSGAQYKARCPFHNEKTPSFYVSPERGTYHCFGCSEHGDIFSFIERIESVPFYEALSILAERAGIKLTPFKKEEKDKEQNLIKLLQRAEAHYQKNLKESPETRVYLSERGLTEETINKFKIGFALGGEFGWRDIFIKLSKDGFSPEEMVRAGIVIKKEGEEKYFDRFRGRVIFPIQNSFGNTVGFSARILPKFDDTKIGKYINSPETEIYHKSKILFGYNLARKAIAEKREVILVEGQMDMIMSHQAEVENVIATSGTAVTEEHIKILKRFADRLILAFDQDQAGEKAMKRCALLALYGGLDVYVVPQKEEVKDTADLIKEFGPKIWQDLLQKKVHIIEFILQEVFKKINDERERLVEIRKEIFPLLRAIESEMERNHFIKYLASKLNIGETEIVQDLNKFKAIGENAPSKEVLPEQKKEGVIKKIRLLRQILAILAWKIISEEKFKEKNFSKLENFEVTKVDFSVVFDTEKLSIPKELVEEDIIKIEKEISGNHTYLEDKKQFIERYITDLAHNYKLEVLLECAKTLENGTTEEELKRLILLRQEIQLLKNQKNSL